METVLDYSREAMLGRPTHWKACDLGVVQQRHDYDQALLDRICRKALAIREEQSEKRHLNLRFIRAAHEKIPEIRELMVSQPRLERLSRLAGARLEPYPVSVIASTITFMGADEDDGNVDWHADGVPITELIPLHIEPGSEGGDLLIYQDDHDYGMSLLERGHELPEERMLRVAHRRGYSTLAQLMRVLHRAGPFRRGFRVTLNLNLRSAERPFVDDNAFYYLGADNPDFAWEPELLRDIRERQLPAYLAQA